MHPALVTDSEEYADAMSMVKAVIVSPDVDFPEFVLHSEFRAIWFLEFDSVLTRAFYRTLRSLADAADEDRHVVASIRPSGDSFLASAGHFGIARLERCASDEEYFDAISWSPRTSPVESIWIRSERVVCTGSSGEWVVWADRESGLGVAGLRGEAISWPSEIRRDRIHYSTALDILSLQYRDQRIPDRFAKLFEDNYYSKVICPAFG